MQDQHVINIHILSSQLPNRLKM